MPSLSYEILVDRSEKPEKCTILPLDGRPHFDIRRFARGRAIPALRADLLLHIDGAPLDTIREQLRGCRRIGVIDCQWKRVPQIAAQLEKPLPPLGVIPPGFVTAYPRRNKEGNDPEGGLATIEAIFIAAAFCGEWDETLFAKYHFAQAFLQMNREAFAMYGLLPEQSARVDASVG